MRIMYLMGGLDRDIGRYVGRCIGRCVGRYSVEYRSSIGRYSAEISADSRSSIGWVSAVCRSTRRPICVSTDMVVISLTLGRYLIDTLPIVYRYLTDTQSTHGQSMIWNQYEGELVRIKAYFDSEFSFFVDITRMLYQVLGVVVFQLTRTIVIEHVECNKGS